MKVQLLRRPRHPWADRHTRHSHNYQLTASLPFFRTAAGSYIHRVRSATVYYQHGQFSHVGVSFWCGGSGSTTGRRGRVGEFLETPSDTSVICATCEGRAIGAGLTESRQIAGRTVQFSPRT